MDVKTVWCPASLPGHIIIEMADGTLHLATVVMARNPIAGTYPYKGHDPRKAGYPEWPAYMYRVFGMRRTEGAA